jgi:acetyl esterase/lipase
MRKKLIFPLIAILVTTLACNSLSGARPESVSAASPAPSQRPPLPVTQPPAVEPAQSSVPQRENPADHAGLIQRDVTYCTVDGVDLKMDIYIPKTKTGVTPLVVYVHGGGWSSGDKTEGAGMTDTPALLDAGFTVASLDYRLAPQYKFPAMIEDVKCAMRSLRAHAADYHIDPDKIGVWGGSAGGHLVSMLGVTGQNAGFDVGQYLDQSSRVQAVVDMFGPADLTLGFSDAYRNLHEEVFGGFDLAKASPVTYVSSDDPPFLILQGDADTTVPLSQSQEFYDRLAAAGISAQLVVVHNGPHGLGAPNESPSRQQLTAMIVQFFKEHLKQ